MCRPAANGGRRCPGGHSTSRSAQTARQRLSRARRALAQAEAAHSDPAAITAARERVDEAQDCVTAVREIAGVDQPDIPNAAGLRRAERDALSTYTGGEFLSINRYVQDGYQLPAYAADDRDYARYMRQKVAALERAVNRSRLTGPTDATRAIGTGTADMVYGPVGSLVGQTVTEHRFTSTTLDSTPPPGLGDVTLTYHLDAGTKALDVNNSGVACKEDEHELLLAPHQSFTVLSDALVEGKRVIHLHSTGDVT